MTSGPPAWARWLLLLALKKRDQETIPGDLLEEYRERIAQKSTAGPWFFRQLFSILWRWAFPAGLLITAGAFVRFVLDALVQPADFGQRSTVTTLVAAFIYLAASSYAAWRSGRLASGPLLAICATLLHCVFNAALIGIFLIGWGRPQVLANIRSSGGLDEALTMSIFPGLPFAAVLGTIGGFLGKWGRGGTPRFSPRTVLACVCTLTLLATGYLTMSLLILQPPHTGYRVWPFTAAFLTMQSIVTLATMGRRVRWAAFPGAALLMAMAINAAWSSFTHKHFDGYVPVLGLILLIQGLLTILTLLPSGANNAEQPSTTPGVQV